MKSYKDIYEFPLTVDRIGWIRDNKRQFVAQIETDNDEVNKHIVDIINGESLSIAGRKFTHKDGEIISNGEVWIIIRGWGNLTGTGAHHLSVEEASNIQDTFAEFIVNTLNGQN